MTTGTRRALQRAKPITTRILVVDEPEVEAPHPFCLWPQEPIDLDAMRRTILTVETWDGSRKLLDVTAGDELDSRF